MEFTIVEGNFYFLMIGFKTKPIENGQMTFFYYPLITYCGAPPCCPGIIGGCM